MTSKFNRVYAVEKENVRVKYHQAECSGSWVIVVTQKKKKSEVMLMRRATASV